jgi:hypothetical protein
LGFSTGAAYGEIQQKDREREWKQDLTLMFPVEGHFTTSLFEGYDLNLSAHTLGILAAEGNYSIIASPVVQLTIPHGIGLGFHGDKSYGFFHLDLIGGMVIQFAIGGHTAFLGAKYALAMMMLAYGRGSDHVYKSHVIVGSVGFAFRVGKLRITPEIVAGGGFGELNSDPIGSFDYWIVVPMVNMAAEF